jgi:F-type H+-transporting ATPase subunit delta
MMRDTTVAARYAKALFIVTEKRGETPAALADLKTLWEVVKPGTQVGHFLATPQVLLTDKRRVLREQLEKRCHLSVVLFIDLLLRKKRLGELATIVTAYEALVERAQGIQRAEVVSAVPLTPAETRRLHADLERSTGKKIRLASLVEPALIGGALVRIGDRVIDRTVQSLLQRIGEQLQEASV